MFADDVALLATSVSGLQSQLSSVRECGIKWGLTVTVAKNEDGGVLYRSWSYSYMLCHLWYRTGRTPCMAFASVRNDSRANYVTNKQGTCHLVQVPWCAIHSRTGVLNAGVPRSETGAGQALAFTARMQELGLHDPALQVRLSDVLVRSGLLYGAQLWAVDGLERTQTEGDAIHIKYLRGVLSARSAGTPSDSVLAFVHCRCSVDRQGSASEYGCQSPAEDRVSTQARTGLCFWSSGRYECTILIV